MSMTKQKPEGSNAGCWLTAIVTVFLALILVIVALFLPPFSLYDTLVGKQYAQLQLQGEAIQSRDSGLTLALAADAQGEFGAAISVSSLQDFEAANAASADWIPAAKSAVPYYLAVQSNVYSIRTEGKAPLIQLSVVAPMNASPTLLDLYGWYGDATVGEWRFIPSRFVGNRIEAVVSDLPYGLAVFQAAPDAPHVLLSYDIDTSLNADAASVSSIVSPAGLQPWIDGTVQGQLAAGSDSNGNYLWMPVIRNFADPRAIDSETVVAIISNPALRSTHIGELSSLVNANGFDGLVIDYRAIPAEQRDNYSAFIRELSSSLHGLGKALGVIVPSAENINGVWETGAYDWRALGASVDYFEIQLGINPQLYTSGQNQFVEALLTWAVGEVDRSKITLGISALSVRDIAGVYTPIAYDEALAGLGDVIVEADNVSETGTIRPGSTLRAHLDGRKAIGGVNEALHTPYLDYVDNDGNVTARIWVTTGNALRFRMDWTARFALGGVAFSDLLEEGVADGVIRAIGEFRTQIPTQPTSATWQLRWRIVNSAGEVVQVETTNLDADLEVALQAPDGNYAINPSVVLIEEGIEQETVRTGAQVALFSPTSTPTPIPTATPAPTATITPTLPPVVATNAVVTGGGGGNSGNVNPLASGRINLSGFSYGGHVTSTGSTVAINAMNSAGMTWMKVQVRYSGDAGGAIAAVQQAHAAGFKILIGAVGYPRDLAEGGSAYMTNYANWVAAIAAGGADAIEIWNEPNLDREWPNGQLGGEMYTQLLSASYNAIKRANGSTIVISGAPAPTGAESAYPGAVLNDNNFLRQMVAAGGLNYLDCVGVHYNEGIVGPLEVSGDPRGDNYYTRYLPSLLQEYRSIVGGRPICFTELGYLTPEGYPPLPDYFAWGQINTVAEQSAWLAQAAAYLSQQPDVRMMIVWNVDFTAYAGDPQGGYAIVRPGGSCPACTALSGAR